MRIPIDALPAETLQNILEAHVLREGTDYGEQEVTFADKVQQLHRALIDEQLVLVYSELHESVNLMTIDAFRTQQQTGPDSHRPDD